MPNPDLAMPENVVRRPQTSLKGRPNEFVNGIHALGVTWTCSRQNISYSIAMSPENKEAVFHSDVSITSPLLMIRRSPDD